MAKINLKPCPFCGGEAEFAAKCTIGKGNVVGKLFTVSCRECKISLPHDYKYMFDFGADGDVTFDTDERLLAASDWNRRTDKEETT